MTTAVDVVVIGAGISGLATAWNLQRAGVRVEVFEQARRPGGAIGTRRRDGALYELGPNSTLDTSPLIDELLGEVGARRERIEASAVARTRFIVRDGALVPLPMSPGAFVATPAFSPAAKLRLFAEPFVRPLPADAEESIAAFVRRRLGREFLDYAIDPFVAGIYAGDPERISVAAAFPRLHALEQKYGSLIKGQIQGARERRRNPEAAKNVARSFSFRDGMQTLTDSIAGRLHALRCGVRATRIVRDDAGEYAVEGEQHGRPFVRNARSIVVAVPADGAASLVESLAPEAAQALREIPYAPVAVVAAAYRREDVGHSLAGFGCLVPKVEGMQILGSLFSSSMFEGRAPQGTVLLTTFAGGRRNPAIATLADADVVETVRHDLAVLLQARRAPLWTEVVRWPRAIPQYEIGHLARIATIERAEEALPGLAFCASYRGGVSVGDCIKNAQATARKIEARLAAVAAPA
jgi:oxygen-dependent protoporphyrinogen oxidase